MWDAYSAQVNSLGTQDAVVHCDGGLPSVSPGVDVKLSKYSRGL